MRTSEVEATLNITTDLPTKVDLLQLKNY